MEHQSLDTYCPSCGLVAEARVVATATSKQRPGVVAPFDIADSEYRADHYTLALCRRCESPFLQRETVYGIPAEFETVTHTEILYPQTSVAPLEGLPDSIRRPLEQASRSFSTGSYDACALMCRRALEALCKTLSAPGPTLASRIDSLGTLGHIDSKLVRWAHGVRFVGNSAAHDVETAVTAQDAQDIMTLAEAILMYVFTLDARFRAFEARRSQRSGADSGEFSK